MIEITESQIKRVDAILSGVKNARGKVFSNAINRGLTAGKTEASKAIRQTYNVKAGTINKHGNTKIKRASSNNPIGQIEYAGAVIPLIEFKVSPREANKRKTVTAAVLKNGTGSRIEAAYVTNLKYGLGVFERLTSKRESSQTLYGPSVAHMAENAKVLPKVEEKAQQTVNERVEHEIERILNGYGG